MSECKAPVSPVIDPPSSPGACLVLGLAGALVLAALPDALLLPATDRLAPRHLGLLVVATLLSGGWWAAVRLAGRRGASLSRRALLATGAAATAGGFLAAVLLTPGREALAAALRGGSPLPYHVLVVLGCAALAAPVALPLGALLAPALSGARRQPTSALLLGAAAGMLLAPWLLQVLLGPVATLQVAGLLCGSAALLLAERGPQPVSARALPLTAAAALPLAGLALSLGAQGLEAEFDRGGLVAPWLAAVLVLAAAAGSLLPARLDAPLLLGAAAVLVPAAFADGDWLVPVPQRDALHELLRLVVVAAPTGLALGATLVARGAGRGLPLPAGPALLALFLPLASVVLLPLLPPRALLPACAAPLALLALPHARAHALGLLTLAAAAALTLSGVGPEPPPGAVPAHAVARTRDGTLALVRDPATGQQLLALDGRAPFGRSAPQMRRMAHLPLLLHPDPARVLLVSADRGESAAAAWASGCTTLHWLQPYARPAEWDFPPVPCDEPPTSGSERQFLAVEREPYDVLVMLPDPRAATRGALLGTVEFFQLAQARLQPDGILCQWWDLADTDISDVKSVLAAAQWVFPVVHLLTDHPRTRRGCVGVVCSSRPLLLDPADLDRAIATRGLVGDDLAAVGLDGFALASLLTMDRGLLELFAPRGDARHDERPALSVRGALRPAGMAQRLQVGLAVVATHRREPMPWVLVPEPERPLFDAISRDRFRAWQHLYGGALDVVAAGGPVGPAFDLEAPGAGPELEAEHFLQALSGLPDWRWLRDQVTGFARRLEAEGRQPEAEHFLRRAVDECDPGSAPLRYALAGLVERKGDHTDAITLYRTVLAFDAQHKGAREGLRRLGAEP